jgi:hypothetical protein
MVFSVEDRDRVRGWLLERAREDERVVSGAVVGAEAADRVDRWSDIDLTFGVADGVPVEKVLESWTDEVVREFDAVVLFDLPVGSTIYRVFLLPGSLQVDLSFAPAAEFGAGGPDFRLLFGSAVEHPRPTPQPVRQVAGLIVHHLVRARFCIERERWWQAEYWIADARHLTMSLACRRLGLEPSHGRGFDRLPADVLAGFEPVLVRALDRTDLLRALNAACVCLQRETSDFDSQLRALVD